MNPDTPANSGALEIADRLQLFEVTSQLIMSDCVAAPSQREHLTAVLAPLVEQFNALVADQRLSTEPALVKHMCNLIEAMGCVSKGCPKSAGPSTEVFQQVLDTIAANLQKL